MSQKRNKLIVLIGLIITSSIIIISINQYFHSPNYLKQKLISQCEDSLDRPDESNRVPPQRVCKINKNEIQILNNSEDLSSSIKPGDTIIFSLNFKKLLNRQLYNVYTGQEINKPQDNKTVFCFVIYPVLMKNQMKIYNEDEYKEFYAHYVWEIYPKDILNYSSRGDNFICTKLNSLNTYSKISAVINIPSESDLKLGYGDTKSYGFKIVMAPENLKTHNLSDKDVEGNYSQFIPLYHFIKSINFK